MKKIRFCPKCGSKDVDTIYSVLSYMVGFERMVCNKCGYQGMFFPECYEEEYRKIKAKFK
ncbi:MAG: hypothetical protein KKC38_02245 [Nanoarchaeota archaeon]|nr:hypothetical protein [Nanoarchaeota archaeon]